MIYEEMCKKLKFDYSNRWYTHKLESILENEMLKIHWDFEIETDHLIPFKRLDQMLINQEKKRNCHQEDFAFRSDRRVKINKSKKIIEYLDLALKLKKKNPEYVDGGITYCCWYA